MRGRALICVAAMCAAANVGAQQAPLGGIVRDSATGLPLPGSVIQALGPDSQVIARGLTSADGRFQLNDTRGARWLQVRHIGYHTGRTSLERVLGNGQLEVSLVRLPQQLDPVVVSGDQGCPKRADEGRAFALWQEAKTSLLATVIAREAHPGRMRVLRFDRKIDGGTGQMVRQAVRLAESSTGRPFFAVTDAAQFAVRGYIREDSTGRTYYGPDADVLLDGRFIDTHCLTVAASDSVHPGQIGLAFAPSLSTARDTVVDVRGALWLDSASHELQSLEFRFTKLEPAAIDARAGGVVGFRTMSNGVVFIDHWSLHLPMLTTQTLDTLRGPRSRYYIPQPFAKRVRNGDAMVVEPHDVGGAVAYAEWPDGAKFNAGLATLRGVAVERDTHLPAAHTIVALDSTPYTTVTDDRGAFELPGVLPGVYAAMAIDSSTVRLGLRRSRRVPATAAFSGGGRITIEVTPDDEAIDDYCGPVRIGFETILRGVVLSPSGAPAPSTHLAFSWDASLDDAAPTVTEVVANAMGEFSVCTVPRDRSPRIRATGDRGAHLEGRLALTQDSPVQIVTIRLVAP